MTDDEMTQSAINTIRTLSIDTVQKAKSGHPGTPMALAEPDQVVTIAKDLLARNQRNRAFAAVSALNSLIDRSSCVSTIQRRTTAVIETVFKSACN